MPIQLKFARDNYFSLLLLLVTSLFASISVRLLGREPIYSVLLYRAGEKSQRKTQTDSIWHFSVIIIFFFINLK